MLPVGLLVEIDRLRVELGLSRSALLAMAASCFISKIASALKPAHRKESLAVVERIFAKLMEEARETT